MPASSQSPTGSISSPAGPFSPSRLTAFPKWIRSVPILVGLFVYGVFLARHYGAIAAGADSGGYMNSAKLLAEGRLTTPVRSVPEFQPQTRWPYTPLGFVASDGAAEFKPTYPLGLPLHYAVAGKLLGWKWGTTMVAVLAAIGSVLLTYASLREFGVSAALSFVGAAALALSPLVLYMSFIPMSDTVALVWISAAIYAALRAGRDGAWIWPAVAGFSLSVAVLVRPTNLLVLPTLVLLLPGVRAWWVAALAALPGGALNAWYNHALYGSAFKNGYGGVGEEFGWAQFAPGLQNYLASFHWVLPIAWLALIGPVFLPWRQRGRVLVGLSLWAFGLPLFYAFYHFTQLTWWFLRFLLPAFPALLMLGLLAEQEALTRIRPAWRKQVYALSVAVTLAVSLGLGLSWAKARRIIYLGSDQATYLNASLWAKDHLPKDALVVSSQLSSALYFYTDFPVFRWDYSKSEECAALLNAIGRTRRPLYALIYEFEREDAFRNLPGRWTKVASFRAADSWRYDGPMAR